MKKALVVATVGGFIDFEKKNIKRLEELGYEVHIACAKKGWEEYLIGINENVIDIPFDRNPLSSMNMIAFKELKELIHKEKYQLIHCHTPIAGVLTRLAAKKVRKTCKVIYTAHGFHFYKGALIKNWFIFYPAEWISAWYTDILITINSEDYALAKKKLHAKKIEYVPGIGIDVESIWNLHVNCEQVKLELGLMPGQKMLLSVGELNKNKNHRIVIEALSRLNDKNIHYYIAGEGELKEELEKLAEQLNIGKQVHLLGYRKDIIALNKSADLFCFPSHREGLSVSLMESIACGTPVICSNIRGNRDLANGNSNVLLFDECDVDDCALKIKTALCLRRKINNQILNYSTNNVGVKMDFIYRSIEDADKNEKKILNRKKWEQCS